MQTQDTVESIENQDIDVQLGDIDIDNDNWWKQALLDGGLEIFATGLGTSILGVFIRGRKQKMANFNIEPLDFGKLKTSKERSIVEQFNDDLRRLNDENIKISTYIQTAQDLKTEKSAEQIAKMKSIQTQNYKNLFNKYSYKPEFQEHLDQQLQRNDIIYNIAKQVKAEGTLPSRFQQQLADKYNIDLNKDISEQFYNRFRDKIGSKQKQFSGKTLEALDIKDQVEFAKQFNEQFTQLMDLLKQLNELSTIDIQPIINEFKALSKNILQDTSKLSKNIIDDIAKQFDIDTSKNIQQQFIDKLTSTKGKFQEYYNQKITSIKNDLFPKFKQLKDSIDGLLKVDFDGKQILQDDLQKILNQYNSIPKLLINQEESLKIFEDTLNTMLEHVKGKIPQELFQQLDDIVKSIQQTIPEIIFIQQLNPKYLLSNINDIQLPQEVIDDVNNILQPFKQLLDLQKGSIEELLTSKFEVYLDQLKGIIPSDKLQQIEDMLDQIISKRSMVDQLKQLNIEKLNPKNLLNNLQNNFKPSDITKILPTENDINEFRAFWYLNDYQRLGRFKPISNRNGFVPIDLPENFKYDFDFVNSSDKQYKLFKGQYLIDQYKGQSKSNIIKGIEHELFKTEKSLGNKLDDIREQALEFKRFYQNMTDPQAVNIITSFESQNYKDYIQKQQQQLDSIRRRGGFDIIQPFLDKAGVDNIDQLYTYIEKEGAPWQMELLDYNIMGNDINLAKSIKKGQLGEFFLGDYINNDTKQYLGGLTNDVFDNIEQQFKQGVSVKDIPTKLYEGVKQYFDYIKNVDTTRYENSPLVQQYLRKNNVKQIFENPNYMIEPNGDIFQVYKLRNAGYTNENLAQQNTILQNLRNEQTQNALNIVELNDIIRTNGEQQFYRLPNKYLQYTTPEFRQQYEKFIQDNNLQYLDTFDADQQVLDQIKKQLLNNSQEYITKIDQVSRLIDDIIQKLKFDANVQSIKFQEQLFDEGNIKKPIKQIMQEYNIQEYDGNIRPVYQNRTNQLPQYMDTYQQIDTLNDTYLQKLRTTKSQDYNKLMGEYNDQYKSIIDQIQNIPEGKIKNMLDQEDLRKFDQMQRLYKYKLKDNQLKNNILMNNILKEQQPPIKVSQQNRVQNIKLLDDYAQNILDNDITFKNIDLYNKFIEQLNKGTGIQGKTRILPKHSKYIDYQNEFPDINWTGKGQLATDQLRLQVNDKYAIENYFKDQFKEFIPYDDSKSLLQNYNNLSNQQKQQILSKALRDKWILEIDTNELGNYLKQFIEYIVKKVSPKVQMSLPKNVYQELKQQP